jgi:LacI family transcriptional regulator
VILCNTDESEVEQDKYLRVLLQKQVDGVLLVPARSTVEPIRFVQGQDTPVVVLDRRIPDAQADAVRCDSEEGAHQLTRLLLSLGHRRIAMLSGPQGVSTAEDRVAGYRRALTEAGLDVDPALVYYGEFSLESGYDMTEQILARTPRPSALFAGNNFIAIGALRALRDAGLRVPEDLALVGFDDLPEDLVVDPFLTVAAQPAYGMGRQATELLLARLSEETPAAYQEIVLPTVIVVRESSGQVLEQQSG